MNWKHSPVASTLCATLLGTLVVSAVAAAASPDAVRVVNGPSAPVPVTGAVTVTGTPSVSISNTVPVTVAAPVTIANPVTTVTVANTATNPIPVTVTGGSGGPSGTPFFGRMVVLNSASAIGAPNGTLSISNITLTNFDASPQQVFLFAAVLDPASQNCEGGTVIGGASPQMTVYVAPQSTLVIPYPAPLVFNPIIGQPTCIAAEVTTLLHGGSVQVVVTGVSN